MTCHFTCSFCHVYSTAMCLCKDSSDLQNGRVRFEVLQLLWECRPYLRWGWLWKKQFVVSLAVDKFHLGQRFTWGPGDGLPGGFGLLGFVLTPSQWSEGFYPTACAPFVSRGPLFLVMSWFGFFQSLTGWCSLVAGSTHVSIAACSQHFGSCKESGDPRVEKSMQFKKCYWCDSNFNL